jgi:hypothetical protein
MWSLVLEAREHVVAKGFMEIGKLESVAVSESAHGLHVMTSYFS